MVSPRLQRSVINALNTLIVLARDGEASSISDLARRMNLDKSTMYRLLCTLEDRGFVARDNITGNYKVGLRAFEVGNAYMTHLEIVDVAAPIMLELAQKVGQRVNLAVRDEDENDLVFVRSIDVPGILRTRTGIGRRGCYHATAVGKAMLARMPWEEAEKITVKQGLAPLTCKTITDMAALKSQIDEIRVQGYALDDEENSEYMRCVAAAIVNHHGSVVGGVSISALIHHLPDEKVPEFGGFIKEAAQRISQKLGYLGG